MSAKWVREMDAMQRRWFGVGLLGTFMVFGIFIACMAALRWVSP